MGRAALSATVLVLLLACRAEEVQPEAEPEPTDSNLVATTSGPVRGETVDGARVFRGIPYASPPGRRLALETAHAA